MPPAVTHVHDLASTLLDTVIDIYADNSLTLPARQLVPEGQVALDCELVAVTVARTFRGLAGAATAPFAIQRCASVRTAEFHLWIVRCASTPQDSGEPPEVSTVEGYSRAIYTDAWVLPYYLAERAVTGDLGLPCENILIADLRIHGPEGGFGAVDLTLEYTLGG